MRRAMSVCRVSKLLAKLRTASPGRAFLSAGALCATLTLLGVAAARAAAPPADASPLAELRKSNATLKKLLAKQPPSWSPENDARNSEVRKVVDQFLDFEELARRSLARHWDGLTPRQRTEFVSTLRDLVERNYLKQIHGEPNYDLKFDKESKEGSEATVHATLTTTSSKGKKVNVDLEY